MLHVVVGVVIRAERMDAFLCLLAEHAAGSRAEPGCLRFEVLRQTSAPCRFRILETWEGPAALEAHRRTAHYARWKAEMPAIQAGPRTHEEYEEVPPGRRVVAAGGKVIPAALLPSVRAAADARGRKVVFTNGCWDLLGSHHLHCLGQARAAGDVLVVGVNDDRSVRRLKGPGRPIIPGEYRTALLAGLSCVDFVVSFSEDTPVELVKALRPDVLVKSEQYRGAYIAGAEFAGEILFVSELPGFSTTTTVHKIRGAAGVGAPAVPDHEAPLG